MADLNALIAQGAQFNPPPNPFVQYGQMQQLQLGQNQNQLAKLQVQTGQRDFDIQNRLTSLYGSPGFNLQDPAAIQQVGAISPAAAMALQKAQLDNRMAQSTIGKNDVETTQRKQDFLNQGKRDMAENPSDENVTAWTQDAVRKGYLTPEQGQASLVHMLSMAPEDRVTHLQGAGATAASLATLAGQKSTAATALAGQQSTAATALAEQAVTMRGQNMTAGTAATQGAANRANAVVIANIRTNAGLLTPEQNDALYGPNGAVTLGKLDPYKVNSRTSKILANAYLANPNTDMNKLGSDATLMRNATFMGKQQTVEMLPEILSNVTAAGKKVNYSGTKFAGAVQQFAKGQLNDPDFTAYMTQRNDALLTIAGVMRGNGATDQAHQAEIEAASPTMSPKALDAWLAGQTAALKPRLANAAKFTRSSTVVTPPATPASAPTGVDSSNPLLK